MSVKEAGDLQFGSRSASEPPPLPESGRRAILIAAAAAVVAALGAGLWLLLGGDAEDARETPVAEMTAESPAPDALPPPVELDLPEELPAMPQPVELPALDASDGFVRELADALLAHPNLAAWLVGDHLLRRFVVATHNVANGRNPAQHFGVLRPARRFRAAGEGEQQVIDADSFQRYDLLAGVVGALDPRAAALLYVTLEPLLDEAHLELGNPDTPFRGTLERAVAQLLAAPIVETPPLVLRRATHYVYADAGLESLTPAQKQFLGMGPGNVQVVQAQLRAMAGEIGLTVE